MGWIRFLKEHWNRCPGSYRSATLPIALDPRDCFEVLLDCSDRFRHDQSVTFRLFLGNSAGNFSTNFPETLKKHLPTPSDRDLSSYIDRVTWSLRGEPQGLILNGFNRFSRPLSTAIRHFYAEVLEVVAAPFASVQLEPDLFVGNYERTAFGIHKDTQHVFTQTLLGSKTFRLWPYEAFRNHPIVRGGDHRRAQTVLGIFDAIPSIESELRLEADAQSLIYWPPEYWHVMDAARAPSATVGYGLSTEHGPLRLYEQSVTEYLASPQILAKLSKLPQRNGWNRILAGAHRALASEAFRTHLEAKRFAAESTLTSKYPYAGPAEPISMQDALGYDPKTPLAFVRRGSRLLIAVHGRTFRLRYRPGLTTLFRALRSDPPFVACSWLRAHPRAGLSENDVLEILHLLSRFGYVWKLPS